MLIDELKDYIKKVFDSVLEDLDVDLVELKVYFYNHTFMIDAKIDHPTGGILMDEVVRINRQIVDVLDVDEHFSENYEIQVSSPGVDFPLRKKEDFKRVISRKVRCHLIDKVDGKLEFLGQVSEVKEEVVLIKTKNDVVSIPYKIISKAVQIVENN